MDIALSITVINILIGLFNLGTLALNLKLYTEYFKDKSMSKRTETKSEK